jgi:hypothetical protein
MAKSASAQPTDRLPRGTKPVCQAFLSALDSIPEGSRTAVAKAALSMIRDELKSRKEKSKASAAKPKTSKLAVTKSAAKKKPPSKAKAKPTSAAPKQHGRKLAEAPTEV